LRINSEFFETISSSSSLPSLTASELAFTVVSLKSYSLVRSSEVCFTNGVSCPGSPDNPSGLRTGTLKIYKLSSSLSVLSVQCHPVEYLIKSSKY